MLTWAPSIRGSSFTNRHRVSYEPPTERSLDDQSTVDTGVNRQKSLNTTALVPWKCPLWRLGMGFRNHPSKKFCQLFSAADVTELLHSSLQQNSFWYFAEKIVNFFLNFWCWLFRALSLSLRQVGLCQAKALLSLKFFENYHSRAFRSTFSLIA